MMCQSSRCRPLLRLRAASHSRTFRLPISTPFKQRACCGIAVPEMTWFVTYIDSCTSANGLRDFACAQEEQRIDELEYMKLEAFYRAEWGLKPGGTL